MSDHIGLRFKGTDLSTKKHLYSLLYVTEQDQIPLQVENNIYQPMQLDQCKSFKFYRYEFEVDAIEQQVTYIIGSYKYTFATFDINQSPRLFFYSCNGMSSSVSEQENQKWNGIKPLWVDVLREHQKAPFHGQIGGMFL